MFLLTNPLNLIWRDMPALSESVRIGFRRDRKDQVQTDLIKSSTQIGPLNIRLSDRLHNHSSAFLILHRYSEEHEITHLRNFISSSEGRGYHEPGLLPVSRAGSFLRWFIVACSERLLKDSSLGGTPLRMR
jgi:hypothetical protein